MCLASIRVTQAERVRPATMCPPRVAQRNLSSCVSKYGYVENADLKAAINILRAGHAQPVCQVNDAVMSSATGAYRGHLPHSGVEAAGILLSLGGGGC